MAFHYEISVPGCSHCTNCCISTPTWGIRYHTLQFLSQSDGETLLTTINQVESKATISEGLALFEIPLEILDSVARGWCHWFGLNLLADYTVANQDRYLILGILKTRRRCLFLVTQGCLLDPHKPWHCKLYPFFFERDRTMYSSPQCPGIVPPNFETSHATAWDLVAQYATYCRQHKADYPRLARELAERWRISRKKVLRW